MRVDQGTNLTKASPYLQDEDPENWGWDRISKLSAKKGTTPPACQFKDGLAESRVKMLKTTMVNLTAEGDLNFTEYMCNNSPK